MGVIHLADLAALAAVAGGKVTATSGLQVHNPERATPAAAAVASRPPGRTQERMAALELSLSVIQSKTMLRLVYTQQTANSPALTAPFLDFR